MSLRLSTAAELMTPNPLSFDKGTPICKASAMLAYYALEAAPVVDGYGRLAGLVSASACAAWKEFSMRSSPHFDVRGVDPAPSKRSLARLTRVCVSPLPAVKC
jgi:CBS-domain-containing membrane protein